MNKKWIIGALVIIIYWVFGFYPFNFNFPLQSIDQVKTDTDGVMHFSVPGIVYLRDTSAWLHKAIENGSLDITLEVWTDNLQQTGPARIFTISQDPSFRDLTIAQNMNDLVIRLRRQDSSLNGTPEFRVKGVFGIPGWHSIDVAVSKSRLLVQVDGKVSIDEPFYDDPFKTWSSDYRLALGNEPTLDRPWLGKIRRAAVTIQGQTLELQEEGVLERPGYYYVPGTMPPIHWQPFTASSNSKYYLDWIVNFLGFIPLGFLMARTSGRKTQIITTVIYCAVLSLSIELGQLLFFHDRNPSVNDLIFNSLGGFVGVMIGKYWQGVGVYFKG